MKTDRDIEQRAAEWLIRRDRGEEGPEQRQEFEQWLAADTRHRQAYLDFQKRWQHADKLRAWVPHQGAVDPALLKNYAVRRREPWKTYALAATILISVAVAGLYLVLQPGLATTYFTDIGGYQRITLKDGSTLQLNTDSKARVRYSSTLREIKLLKGEGYFQVARDPTRPFEVTAADKTVRALGTAFTVRVKDRKTIEVIVTEGKVSLGGVRSGNATPGAAALQTSGTLNLDASGPAVVLTANQAVSTNPKNIVVRTLAPLEANRRLAWQTGQLSFKGETLDVVIAEFNRYNDRQLQLADPALARLQVGGDFQATDIDSFIAALQRSFEVSVDGQSDVISISGSGKAP